MRHFHLRRQPHEPRVRPSTHAPVPAAAAAQAVPAVDAALDQAAALWTTRRIRSFLVLQPSCTPRR
ncbi:hypothetical protein [Variovorax paradoxus]|jgi:hypothetical protein|uniref:Uncharacterized protein n=1 Tax=Variovorax paradoxus TaxID=34073 RepID=A0A679J6H0_VARPD|nr:hypothetical protein VVAX_05505 [Variovorax paradoxus]